MASLNRGLVGLYQQIPTLAHIHSFILGTNEFSLGYDRHVAVKSYGLGSASRLQLTSLGLPEKACKGGCGARPRCGIDAGEGSLPSLTATSRRRALLGPALTGALFFLGGSAGPARAWAPAVIDMTKAPQVVFDAADPLLQEAAALFQLALNAPNVDDEEKLWTLIIVRYGELDEVWVPDIVSRATGNRGNARSRQGKMDDALKDFDKSIKLAPYAVDPVLNRGVALESLGRYEEASIDYLTVLGAQPLDPAAWNNLGNVRGAQGRWEEALENYGRAMKIAPTFSFAAANYGLALYQLGRDNEALKQFRTLLRKYPEFPDIRAALAVSLYRIGLTGEAESNWDRLEDLRYRDRKWVKETRKWPPRLVSDLEAFLDLRP
eukprot:TRINITY_DN19516_c0_g1_i1.p1 TRINITY_DN19516_c0_g1~~TRINITY_DN19516_c0_g1_i1.p1  ORF type:complete len:387 (-),score=41.75 TRINITY_DN19516_c0_g1_i1:131-1264(-)